MTDTPRGPDQLVFDDVVREELQAVNARRAAVRFGYVARLREDAGEVETHPTPSTVFARKHLLAQKMDVHVEPSRASRRTGSWQLSENANLTGMALSGGGIRSAAVSLGVLQALDSLSDHDEPHVLDSLDYLSTVSGGGYTGTALVAAMTQPGYDFPFSSLSDEQETPETQHLRDYSNFLAPRGGLDYLTSAALVARGLIVNALIVAPILLVLAALTAYLTPTFEDLARVPNFVLTRYIGALAFVILIASAVYTSIAYNRGSVGDRLFVGRGLSFLIVIFLGGLVIDLQPYLLVGLHQSYVDAHGPAAWIGRWVGRVATAAVPFAGAILACSQWLANVAKASAGSTNSGAVKKATSKLALYLAGVIVPILLWVGYVYLAFWAIVLGETGVGLAPAWLDDLGHKAAVLPGFGPIGTVYLWAALGCSLFSLMLGPNANSLHRLYRDRLSKAFLIKRPRSSLTANSLDGLTFSALAGSQVPPFLIVNTAINLEASDDLNRRGRNADTFTFSPLHCGSIATGYARTKDMESVVKDLGLATAMATSGAAASANMGDATVKWLTFSLSLLNIRLGYWLANPAKLDAFKSWFGRAVANAGFLFFGLETLGLLDEKTRNVYLTDGGHVENLGIYELLKRRCKVIVAVDAEGDGGMTFPSLINLELIARIDLGVRIELPWQDLQKSALGVTATSLHGDTANSGKGPHAVVGRILYEEGHTGVLIYLKSSLSGDENDYVLDYKRRNSTFPHETTIDQFFTEDQFEAYRALGFHMARNLFTGTDGFCCPRPRPAAWAKDVDHALTLLNIRQDLREAFVAKL